MSSAANGLRSVAAPGEESSLLAGVRVLRERWWIVAATVVVCLAIALALALTATTQYTATATLLVRSSDLAALIDPTQAETTDPARETADTLSLLQSGVVAGQVKSSLHLSQSVSDLQQRVDATTVANTDLVSVSISDPSPSQAARLANAFANSLVSYLTESDQAQVAAGQAQLTSQLSHLSSADSSARAVLEQALRQVVALRAVTNGNVQVVDPAQPPSSPSSPNVKRDAAAGAIAGLVIGLALAFVLDLFDRRIKDTEELEQLYGLSALSMVPLRKPRAVGARGAQADLEPFRIVRDGLGYISLREESRVILVTSAVPSEGKTHVAIGLAQAIASADKSVVLVEVDVHRPAVRTRFRLHSSGRGLMNTLVDGTSALELLLPVPKIPSLSVLPSGPSTPNSAELLRLPATSKVLGELAREFDFVILDGPPLLPVADTRALLDGRMIDVVLVVARPYLTTRQHIRGALAVLKRYPEEGIGLVVNAVRDSAADYYYYSDVSANGGSAEERRVRRSARSARRGDKAADRDA
ncbi:MAG: Wzz/FepE/Etk N-terminal domain-containing protein [Solirubrobacteraceae bacterium]|jgi:capsular exopolysaccharide synthesis family protein